MPSPAHRFRTTLGPSVRRWRRRLDNPEVKAARGLMARARLGRLDVVHLGASESLFVSPADTDQRPLPAMIAADLGEGVRFHSIAGPGYHPRLFQEYVRLLDAGPQRPVIVVALGVRLGMVAWRQHPAYGYARAIRHLARFDPTTTPNRIRGVIRLPSAQEMAEHDRRPHATLAGDLTIGEYRRPLLDPVAAGLDKDAAVKLLYAYHHGAVMASDDPWLDEVAALGTMLRDGGFPVVGYHLPAPVETGTRLYGPAFRERTVANHKVMDDAFRAAYGPATILSTSTMLDESDFIDPEDGTEHVNESGRRKIAAGITPAVQRLLADAAGPGRGTPRR